MRTTVRLNDALLKAAKQVAVERNISLTRIIEEALEEKLAAPVHSPIKRKVTLVTFSGDGLRPGIDLDDSAALLETMDG